MSYKFNYNKHYFKHVLRTWILLKYFFFLDSVDNDKEEGEKKINK